MPTGSCWWWLPGSLTSSTISAMAATSGSRSATSTRKKPGGCRTRWTWPAPGPGATTSSSPCRTPSPRQRTRWPGCGTGTWLITLSASAILTDLMMPRMDGFALLKELAARGNRTPTIVLTAFGSIDQAISIVHDLKAFWFLEKPVQPGVMHTLLERAIQQSHLVEETERLSRQLSYQGVLGDLVGDSAP